MSVYYSPPPQVIDGDTAFAKDVNDVNNETTAAFEAVESDINGLISSVSVWAALAERWATEAEDVAIEPGLYSSFHYSRKSAGSASASATSATNSATSATNSASSATASANSAASAFSSQSAAATSATNASTSASAAATSATNSANSATASATSAAEAASSATTAATEASTAATTAVNTHADLTGTSVHGLGTAATKTSTTSTSDVTVGRVARIGDHGLGSTTGQLYGRNNVNGTVSQSGGVPTGALMQSSTNYAKYADGTLVCWGEVVSSSSTYVTWTYPVPFSGNPPTITAGVKGLVPRPLIPFLNSGSTASTRVYLYEPGAALVGNNTVMLIAVGRWY